MGKAIGVFGKILTYILIVLLVLGVAGGITYFVARAQGVSFFVEFDNQKYFSNVENKNLSLEDNAAYDFSVKSLTGKNIDFKVQITANPDNNFAFSAGTEIGFLWSKDTAKNDYTEFFNVEKNENGFSVAISKNMTVQSVIESKYGSDIVPEKEIQSDLDYFVIEVTSGKNVVRLPFRFFKLTLTLDPSEIIF